MAEQTRPRRTPEPFQIIQFVNPAAGSVNFIRSHAARVTHARRRRARHAAQRSTASETHGQEETHPPDDALHTTLVVRVPSPAPETIGSGRSDPFGSFSRPLHPMENFLLDHCTLTSPPPSPADGGHRHCPHRPHLHGHLPGPPRQRPGLRRGPNDRLGADGAARRAVPQLAVSHGVETPGSPARGRRAAGTARDVYRYGGAVQGHVGAGREPGHCRVGVREGIPGRGVYEDAGIGV